jgi:hypothetical protein
MVGTGQSRSASSTPIGGMCGSHQQAFFNVARALKVWILVRATNKSSLKFIGPAFPDVIPKPKSCDAKTSDAGPNGGLVMCPMIVPDAFSPERLSEAMETWHKWAPEWIPVQFEKSFLDKTDDRQHRTDFDDDQFNKDGLPVHFGVIEDEYSPYFGCVVNFQSGSPKMMHGDYDLYDVVDPQSFNDRRRMELDFNGSKSLYGPKTAQVQEALNNLMTDGQVSSALIQHGEHLAKFDHKEDMIYAFSPTSGDALIIIYPFAFGLESVRSLYRNIFNNRQPLGR